MAKIELGTIAAPISDEQPCGPDLDLEFDMDFMNFLAEIDGKIPTAFFSFEPGSLDFAGYYERIGDILGRTRDLRVLVPLAKLRILQSDLPGFAATLDAIHRLLMERWSDLHPQPAEFLELGMGQLATLDDMPNVVLPLQHAPLVRSRRAGAITLRKWQVAQGEVNPREGEETLDASTIMGTLADADADELGRSRDALVLARDAVTGIRTVCMQEAGYDKAPVLERLPAAIDAALGLIETATDGPAAAEDEAAAKATPGYRAEPVVCPLPVFIPTRRRGRALFRVPRTMWTEIAELAELRLAQHDALPIALRAALERSMVGRGVRTDEHSVERIGQRMRARLFGEDRFFEIVPLSSEVQDFQDEAGLCWDWRVTPIREGYSLLTLRITMEADSEGRPTTVDAQALHTSVEITVRSRLTRPARFVRDNWKWMLGSSGIGAIATIAALLGR